MSVFCVQLMNVSIRAKKDSNLFNVNEIKWNEMKSFFFQHNNVNFTSFNFCKIYMLGKRPKIANLVQIKSKI